MQTNRERYRGKAVNKQKSAIAEKLQTYRKALSIATITELKQVTPMETSDHVPPRRHPAPTKLSPVSSISIMVLLLSSNRRLCPSSRSVVCSSRSRCSREAPPCANACFVAKTERGARRKETTPEKSAQERTAGDKKNAHACAQFLRDRSVRHLRWEGSGQLETFLGHMYACRKRAEYRQGGQPTRETLPRSEERGKRR